MQRKNEVLYTHITSKSSSFSLVTFHELSRPDETSVDLSIAFNHLPEVNIEIHDLVSSLSLCIHVVFKHASTTICQFPASPEYLTANVVAKQLLPFTAYHYHYL